MFTASEQAYCDGRGAVAAQHYAARFAAKEAALKALKTGWRGGIAWQDIEVVSRDNGAPYLIFHGKVLELIQDSGATSVHVSMSHTTEHAIAEVVLERTIDHLS